MWGLLEQPRVISVLLRSSFLIQTRKGEKEKEERRRITVVLTNGPVHSRICSRNFPTLPPSLRKERKKKRESLRLRATLTGLSPFRAGTLYHCVRRISPDPLKIREDRQLSSSATPLQSIRVGASTENIK